MPPDNRRLILANGERLVGKIEKKSNFRPSPLPRSYDEARELVIRQTGDMLRSAAGIAKNRKYPDELFVCFRLHPDMLAKTHEPESLFAVVPDLQKVGSRNWRPSLDDVAQTEKVKKQKGGEKGVQGLGRLLFVKSNEEGYERLVRTLNLSTHVLPAIFQNDIRKIERIDFLSPEEQLQGFGDEWVKGRVEMVLHPSREGAEAQLSFFHELFEEIAIPSDRVRPVFYGDGPGFISAFVTKESLLQLRGCNPLRTAHPLQFNGVTDLRSLTKIKAPPPPAASTTRSTIKVGVFDGGIDLNCPHLKGFAEEDAALSIKSKAHPACTSHGTAVAGAVLYGSLDQYDPKQPLPAPPVSVVSIRAFPPSKSGDPDLYECIDVIENAVPSRPDISIYNVSFGPRGPILDDSISRFTYSLDQLAIEHRVLFFVAVGNDGDDPKLHRIQAPSDLVHGIGVGACCIEDTFFPHSQIFTFNPTSGKGSPKHLHLIDDRAEIASLGRGWKKSDFPSSRSGNRYPTEHEKRDQEYKWDTIVRRSISARATSLHQPFIVLHAIGRHSVVNRFPYAAVVTISAPKFTADLHNEIVRKYPVLQPIRVKTHAEIRIQI